MRARNHRALAVALVTIALAGCAAGDAKSEAAVEVPRNRAPLAGEAKAYFERGEAANDSSDYEAAAEAFARAIELAPYSVEAHDAYTWAVQNIHRPYYGEERWDRAIRELDAQYAALVESDPENPVLVYSRAKLWFYKDREKCADLLRAATEIDPDFAPAWYYMGVLAEGRGDKAEIREYYRRAVEADPGDPEYRATVAFSYMRGAWDEFRPRVDAFLEDYPGTEQAAQMLYWLGTTAPTLEQGIEFYRRSIELHAIEEGHEGRNRWTRSSYSGLFRALQKVDPEAAPAVARRAIDAELGGRTDWPDLYRRQTLLNLARTLREADETDAALRYLEEAGDGAAGWALRDIARMAELETALVYEARGEFERARTMLLDILARQAHADARTALERIVVASGRTEGDALEAIWERRLAGAEPAPTIALPDVDGDTVRFSDYPSRVILLNFWYPACGPCRGEFPYLAAAVRRFSDRGLVALAANIHPAEADEVRPYMENNGFPFRPLQTNADWAEETYGVRGAPANFIIGPEGRILYEPGVIRNPEAQRQFERWLDSLFDYLELQGAVAGRATVASAGTEVD